MVAFSLATIGCGVLGGTMIFRPRDCPGSRRSPLRARLDIGQVRPALRRLHGERPQLAVLDQRHQQRERIELHVQTPGDQVGESTARRSDRGTCGHAETGHFLNVAPISCGGVPSEPPKFISPRQWPLA